MKTLISGLFKYTFMVLLVAGIIFAIAFFNRRTTRPLERFIQSSVLTHILPDTTSIVEIDTVLTPQEELALEIDQRQEQLTERTTLLDSIEQAVNDRMDSVVALRADLEAAQTALTEQEQANLDKLAKLYEAMKPAEASQILLQLNDQTIAQLLSRMGDRQAGKVLGVIDPTRAADITNRLRRLQEAVRQQ